jgi:hypothetical protein
VNVDHIVAIYSSKLNVFGRLYNIVASNSSNLINQIESVQRKFAKQLLARFLVFHWTILIDLLF